MLIDTIIKDGIIIIKVTKQNIHSLVAFLYYRKVNLLY